MRVSRRGVLFHCTITGTRLRVPKALALEAKKHLDVGQQRDAVIVARWIVRGDRHGFHSWTITWVGMQQPIEMDELSLIEVADAET